MTSEPAQGAPTPTQTPQVLPCSICGVDASTEPGGVDAARVTWTFGTERGRPVWTCPACSRRHARSMEGRLDSAWW